MRDDHANDGESGSFIFWDHAEGKCNSIKREIGHLCHDERRPKPSEKAPAPAQSVTASPHAPQPAQTVGLAGPYAPLTVYPTATASLEASAWPLTGTVTPQPFLYQPETFGNEFSVLTYVTGIANV